MKNAHNAHVLFGQRVIQGEYGISGVLGEQRARRVSALIDGDSKSAKLPTEIEFVIKGLFSADRLDYLFRDAYHAGTIEYGMVDIERVIRSFSNIEWDIPCYHEKGAYALAGVIFAYFYMYRALYYHHAVRAAFVLFQRIIYDAFKLGIFKSDELLNPDKYKRFTDSNCLSRIMNCKYQGKKQDKQEGIEYVKNLTAKLLDRKLPKCIITEEDFAEEPLVEALNRKSKSLDFFYPSLYIYLLAYIPYIPPYLSSNITCYITYIFLSDANVPYI